MMTPRQKTSEKQFLKNTQSNTEQPLDNVKEEDAWEKQNKEMLEKISSKILGREKTIRNTYENIVMVGCVKECVGENASLDKQETKHQTNNRDKHKKARKQCKDEQQIKCDLMEQKILYDSVGNVEKTLVKHTLKTSKIVTGVSTHLTVNNKGFLIVFPYPKVCNKENNTLICL